MKFKAFITYISEVHFFISYISEVHFLIMPCQIVTIIQSISKDKFKAFILYISEVHFFWRGGVGGEGYEEGRRTFRFSYMRISLNGPRATPLPLQSPASALAIIPKNTFHFLLFKQHCVEQSSQINISFNTAVQRTKFPFCFELIIGLYGHLLV